MKNSQIENNFIKNIDNKTNMYYDIFTRDDIAKFTYYDYLYIERQKTIHCSEIREKGEKYEAVSSYNIHNQHDKIYRNILDNKYYATYIINQALNLTKPIEEEEIEKYTNRYITNEYTDKETDIVYKMQNKEIYFLIEHQSSVDYSMSFRLEEYKLEIMRSAIDKKKVKTKKYEIPTVIPIVLYTGRKKWTVGRKLNKVSDERLEKLDLKQYNLIDIGKYQKEKLEKSDNFIDKIFLLEKAEDAEEITNILPQIIKQIREEKDRTNLISIVEIILKEKIGQEKANQLIKKEMKGEDENMLACVEMIREENKRIRREGIREGRKKGMREGMREERRTIISNMIEKGMSLKEIREITKATKEEIEEVERGKMKICHHA